MDGFARRRFELLKVAKAAATANAWSAASVPLPKARTPRAWTAGKYLLVAGAADIKIQRRELDTAERLPPARVANRRIFAHDPISHGVEIIIPECRFAREEAARAAAHRMWSCWILYHDEGDSFAELGRGGIGANPNAVVVSTRRWPATPKHHRADSRLGRVLGTTHSGLAQYVHGPLLNAKRAWLKQARAQEYKERLEAKERKEAEARLEAEDYELRA